MTELLKSTAFIFFTKQLIAVVGFVSLHFPVFMEKSPEERKQQHIKVSLLIHFLHVPEGKRRYA